ncbi:MAG: hypothetical protein HKN45_04285 [Flavobacteriales bacterium]|nr:hypothetical protein [Flavobacteriales bacterium]
MAEKLFLEVSVDGTILKSIQRLSISQSIFNHHTFELVVPSEELDPDIATVFDGVTDWIGKDVVIDWETGSFKQEKDGSDSSSFEGIVSDISISGDHSNHMLVTIKGHSPTVLLDGVLNTDSYSESSLSDIYKRASSSNLTSKVKMNDNLTFKDKLPFVVQYNETDFNFLSRMMHRCGEWFYYDGKALSLGLKTQQAIDITKDRIFSLDYSFSVSNPITQVKGRDYKKHEIVDVKAKKPSHKDSIASKVAKESMNLFPAGDENYTTYPSYSESSKEKDQYSKDFIKEELNMLKQGRSNEVFTVYCVTDIAQLQLGSTIRLEGLAYGGEFVITDLTHTCGGKDNYQNHFKAVPSDCKVPPLDHFTYPKLDDCVAIVTNNKDPEKMGRVKVTFDWGKDESPWLRMLMPHTGKGRGFYFVPEENEEVMVGFEMGRADFPYVIGSLYNGKNKFDGHFDSGNKIKSIKTISGNEIIFNDKGSLTVRNGKNSIVLSCKDDGTLTIASNGDIVLEAKKNMSLSCKEDLTVMVEGDYNLEVKGNHEAKVTGDYKMETTGEIGLAATKDLKASATGNIDLSATQNLSGSGLQTSMEGSAKVDVKSTGITSVKGSLVKIN